MSSSYQQLKDEEVGGARHSFRMISPSGVHINEHTTLLAYATPEASNSFSSQKSHNNSETNDDLESYHSQLDAQVSQKFSSSTKYLSISKSNQSTKNRGSSNGNSIASRITSCFRFFSKWLRVRDVIIFAGLILMVYLFSSESEHSDGIQLGATSNYQSQTIYITFTPPINILLVKLQLQPAVTQSDMYVDLQKLESDSDTWDSVEKWTIDLETIDNANYTTDSTTDEEKQRLFEVYDDAKDNQYRFLISTTSDTSLGFTFEVQNLSAYYPYRVICAGVILIGVYTIIVFEVVHRTIASFLGAFVALAVLSKLEERPSLEEVVGWIDFDTCGLLFGMMVMVGIFSQTGFFEWCAIKAYKWSKGNLWKLMLLLCGITGVVSSFLDNVTTILLMTPVVIKLCKMMEIPPSDVIIPVVIFSNIGGTATLVGDPPNVLIANNADIADSGKVTFGSFCLHMIPGILLVSVAVLVLFRKVSLPLVKREPNVNKLAEIEIWKRTARKLTVDNEEEATVRLRLEEYILKLESEILKSDTPQPIDISELEAKFIIKDMGLFVKSCLVLSTVILLFFICSAIKLNLTLAWIAIIGAMMHLVIAGITDFDEIMEKIEFGTLMFFAGLFVLMKALEELGLIHFIADQVSDLIKQVPSGDARLTVAILLLLWVSALVSAFMDNIPFTAAMIPIVVKLGDGDLGLPLAPLVWALSYGVCLGGNGTLVGASANVVACGISESQGYPITFMKFFQTGFLTMIVSMLVVTVYMLVFYVLLKWY